MINNYVQQFAVFSVTPLNNLVTQNLLNEQIYLVLLSDQTKNKSFLDASRFCNLFYNSIYLLII